MYNDYVGFLKKSGFRIINDLQLLYQDKFWFLLLTRDTSIDIFYYGITYGQGAS